MKRESLEGFLVRFFCTEHGEGEGRGNGSFDGAFLSEFLCL